MLKLSVVIPVYHDKDALLLLLAKLSRADNQEHFEVIVVQADKMDDLSSIEGINIRLINAKAPCRAEQFNLGASNAVNEILYFVHADSIPPSSFVKDINRALDAGHLVGGYRLKFSPGIFMLKLNAFITRFSSGFSGGGDQTLFLPKELFEEVGGFKEDYCIMEDFELVHRLIPIHGYHVMAKEVTISSRKYKHNSYLRVSFANYMAFKLYRNKVSPSIIKERYYGYLNKVK